MNPYEAPKQPGGQVGTEPKTSIEVHRLRITLIIGPLGPAVAVLWWLFPRLAIFVVPPILVFMTIIVQRQVNREYVARGGRH